MPAPASSATPNPISRIGSQSVDLRSDAAPMGFAVPVDPVGIDLGLRHGKPLVILGIADVDRQLVASSYIGTIDKIGREAVAPLHRPLRLRSGSRKVWRAGC